MSKITVVTSQCQRCIRVVQWWRRCYIFLPDSSPICERFRNFFLLILLWTKLSGLNFGLLMTIGPICYLWGKKLGWCYAFYRKITIALHYLLDLTRVVLVTWSVGPNWWLVNIFYHWKWTTLGSDLLQVVCMVCQTSMVHSVNDVLLVSVVKYANGSTVWSKGPQNKYDPRLGLFTPEKLVPNLLFKWVKVHSIGQHYLSNFIFDLGRTCSAIHQTKMLSRQYLYH